MTQVRPEYVRIVVLHKRATHLDGVKDLKELKIIWTEMLKRLSQEDFEAIRDEARKWLLSLPPIEMAQVLTEYDEATAAKPFPSPYRVDWSKQIPHRKNGDIRDTSV